MAKKKSKDIIEDRELCQGVMLSRRFFEQKENRLLTLLLKGFIVYLLSMGSIGFYLSAFDIEYNVAMCHIVILVMAIICAMLYYRLLVENLGYLILLIVFAGMVVMFRKYINSGFYAIVNITVDNAAQYFDVDIQRLYNEQIGNRYLTVTCVALFIGIVLDILLNVYISRRMQYVTAIFIVMSLNLIPLYMVMEPDMLYVIMLLAGVSMALCFKSGRHYSPQVSIKRSNDIFAVTGKKKKTEIAYVYDIKAMIQAGIIAACTALIMVTSVSAVKPKDNFNVGYEGNKYKDLTRAAMGTLLVDGWSGFFRMSADRGGMDSGKLGDVSTIHLDYQTDLVLRVTPYSYEPIYLKSFTGVMYNPYENNWSSIEELRNYDELGYCAEANVLKEEYEAGNAYSARGIMNVRNVGGTPGAMYLPYYYYPDSSENVKENDYYRLITYYPRLPENDVNITYSDYLGHEPYSDADLFVPEENMDAVKQIVDELGYLGTDEQIIEALRDYFQNNIPYTVRPGKTPRNKDFVNYFLTENRKGYCSHFATSAVLIFRYLGIPARYVEGYAVDYYQILDGEIVEGSDYSDYYDGYSALGETALIEVDVTDADAHAWVEVYSSTKGWYVVDVTPASSEEEEVEDFWTMFADFMDDSDTADDSETDNVNGFNLSDERIRNIIYAVFALIIMTVLIWLVIRGSRYVVFAVRFSRADVNDRLVMRYSLYRRRLARHDKRFAEMINYREQIEYLADKNPNVKAEDLSDSENTHIDCESIIEILEQAGFSEKEIDEQQYIQVMEWLKNNKVQKKK